MEEQARKARRCGSYLQSETINHWPTHWLTDWLTGVTGDAVASNKKCLVNPLILCRWGIQDEWQLTRKWSPEGRASIPYWGSSLQLRRCLSLEHLIQKWFCQNMWQLVLLRWSPSRIKNALLRQVSSNGPHTCQSFATPRGSHYDRVNSSDP